MIAATARPPRPRRVPTGEGSPGRHAGRSRPSTPGYGASWTSPRHSAAFENETRTADLIAVLVALRQGWFLGPSVTLTALDTLRTQQFREGLPAYLPEEIPVASKTGEVVGVRGDVALFERRDRCVVVDALASDLATDDVDRRTAVLPVFATVGEIVSGLV